tara:strand:+ start:559 stop:1005 length:447 start_codon:yes stop_codon:yes gene_type:complete
MNQLLNYIAKQWGYAGVTHKGEPGCRSAAKNELNGVLHHIISNNIEYFEVERVLHRYKDGKDKVSREILHRCLNESVARAWCDAKWEKESNRMGTTDSYFDAGVCWEWERVSAPNKISRCYDLRVLKRVIDCTGVESTLNGVVGNEEK